MVQLLYLVILILIIKPINSQCSNDYWQCDDGGCVYPWQLCNGHVDCGDGSDETSAKCANNTCTNWQWQCDYGGCITKTYCCDGLFHCADGSDEDELFCNNIWKCNSAWYRFQCDNG
eukprot:278663_1